MAQKQQHKKLGDTLWNIANDLRGAMNADSFRDYMLSFLFLRYLSHNYEESAKKELGRDYLKLMKEYNGSALKIWYDANMEDVPHFEKLMRKKVHYVIKPNYMWNHIAEMTRTHDDDLLKNKSLVPINKRIEKKTKEHNKYLKG